MACVLGDLAGGIQPLFEVRSAVAVGDGDRDPAQDVVFPAVAGDVPDDGRIVKFIVIVQGR